MSDFIEYKGRQYRTHSEVTNAFLNEELDENEYDELFDLVAILLDGLTKTKPRQKYDYWGDPIPTGKAPTLIIIDDIINNPEGEEL